MKKYLVKMSVSGWHEMIVHAPTIDDIIDTEIVEEQFDPSTIDMTMFDIDIDSIVEINDEETKGS